MRLRQCKLHLLEDIDALESKRKVQIKGTKHVGKTAGVEGGSFSSETDSSNDMSEDKSQKEKLLALELEALEHSMELLESGQSMLEASNSQCAFKVFPFAYNMYVCMCASICICMSLCYVMYAHLLVYVYLMSE